MTFVGPAADRYEEEYHFEVLTTEQIVEHMVESIKDVNNVIQVRRPEDEYETVLSQVISQLTLDTRDNYADPAQPL